MGKVLANQHMLAKIQSMYDPYALTVYDGMTLARHHVFSAYNYAQGRNRDAFNAADKAIDFQYKGDRIDANGGMGVGVELIFFQRFKDKLSLVPALDCGDHTDFVGIIKGKLIRIDVTTRLETKHPDDYKRANHYIVVYDTDSTKETWKFFARGRNGTFNMVKNVTPKSRN